MKANQKIEALVYIYDHRCVDLIIEIPSFLKFETLLPSVLEQHAPKFSTRVSTVAFSVCYDVYLKNNPQGTLLDFESKFLTTAAGCAAYQEALNLVAPKLKKTVTVEDIENLYNNNNVG